MKSQFDYILTDIKTRGAQNAAAIKTHHDIEAGERGAFGRGPDSFLHKGERSKPNRHHRIGSHSGMSARWLKAKFSSKNRK